MCLRRTLSKAYDAEQLSYQGRDCGSPWQAALPFVDSAVRGAGPASLTTRALLVLHGNDNATKCTLKF